MQKSVRLLALASLFVLSATLARATLVREKFATDPALDGWQAFGDTNLFAWDPTNQVLDVTWDSSQANSYYYLPLGQTLTTNDGFCVQFDLNLTNVDAIGYWEVAIGLCNLAQSTSTNFSRANVVSPDLFEFDYYPDGPDSYGPSIDASLADDYSDFYFAFDATQPLPLGTPCHVVIIHPPGSTIMTGTVYTNGQVMSTLPSIYAGEALGNFHLDTLAIENYTTTDDSYGDSLYAQGTVANISFATPLPVGTVQAIAPGQVQFGSDTNWLYTLEQTADFQTWSPIAAAVYGNGTNLILQATNVPAGDAFYRVRADLP